MGHRQQRLAHLMHQACEGVAITLPGPLDQVSPTDPPMDRAPCGSHPMGGRAVGRRDSPAISGGRGETFRWP